MEAVLGPLSLAFCSASPLVNMHNGILLTLVTFSLLNQDPSIVLRLAALAGGWRLTAELRMLMMGIAVCVGSCWQMDWQSACVVGVGMGLLGELGLVGGLGVVLFLAAIKTASDVLLTVTFCIYLGLYCSYLTRQIPVVLSHSQSLSQRVSTLRREQSTLQAQLHLEKFQSKPLAERRASRILSKLTDLGRPVTGQSADINLYTEESPVMVDSGLSLPSEDSIDETHRIDLTSDDLDLLVNSVISRETGKWSEQQLKAVSDIFAERLDLRDALSQKLEEAAGSSQRVFKPLPKQKITVREVVLDGAGLLSTVGDWNFDTLSAVQHTQEPLKEIGFTVFRICGLCEEFDIPREKLLGFLTRIEAKYLKENYYHNSVHAADVLNSALHLLMSSLHSLGCFLSVEVFALLVAAIGHDVKHPGFNNSFLIATQDPLALRYNDRSVLEMMHCSLTFQVLERPDSAVTAGLNPPTYMTFRKFVISLILTTDLQKHMSKVKELREYVEDEG